MKHIKTLSVLFILSLTILAACSNDDDPVPVNEEEVITTVTIELTNGTEKVILQSRDLDGDGPNAPEIQGGTLKANTTYSGVITLLNETETPAENITDEVAAEADEHQFFYSAAGIASTFTYTGTNDSNGNPVGINFTVSTEGAGTGVYTVTLRHEPNKSATGVKEGNITNAGGETDVEISFPITVE
ncbi:type 1 periplasmic binding fold superfamily protein [Tenacibaculum tangerinum]|uniref:Type 1 periplasmic binding fold superfamily protein n=1 Tax=Tenacibaculum tangerinum TaxID=3038772 RepID=A0ABY8L731_9FLAO|nr:type 1 periplasmic binding fold superfamily protein [Tenacibaculum tangerinum]WGH76188.1 type 1 periplasmic binding fold superfamily protein [Tenacibaculum tangerinum]